MLVAVVTQHKKFTYSLTPFIYIDLSQSSVSDLKSSTCWYEGHLSTRALIKHSKLDKKKSFTGTRS